MNIRDNIYFWLGSLGLVFIGFMVYYIWIYNPEKIIINDIRNNSEKYSELVQVVNLLSKDLPKNKFISYDKIPPEIKQKLSRL